MDNLYRPHKDNHLENNFHTFINMFELFTTSQASPPPSKQDQTVETQGNPFVELSINHFWDLCDIVEREEEPNLNKVQVAQHTHNTRSKGPVNFSNISPLTSASDPSGNSSRKTMEEKPMTNDIIVNKNDSHVNKLSSV